MGLPFFSYTTTSFPELPVYSNCFSQSSLSSFSSCSQAVDSDLFSNVTYRIKTESARQLFSVNPITGELAVLQTLDFENLAAMGMGASYTFQVEAVDQGGVMPPGQATVTVRITVRAPWMVRPMKTLGCPSLFIYPHCPLGSATLAVNMWLVISRVLL